MRAFVPWVAVVVTTLSIHVVAATAEWSTATTYVVLAAIGFPITVLTTSWADGPGAWRRRGDGHPPHLG